jgi:hypothetical protein
MGTRHLIAVVLDGDFRIAQYGQWDGYPSGQGATVLSFLRQQIKKDNLAAFTAKVRAARFGSEAEIEKLYEEWRQAAKGLAFQDESKFAKKRFPTLTRDTGAEILQVVLDAPDGAILDDNRAFAGEGLFCEYAYVIDLDKRTFEAYVGFCQTPLTPDERFYFLQKTPEEIEAFRPGYKGEHLYYPVRLAASFSLDEKLPTQRQFEPAIRKSEKAFEKLSEAAEAAQDAEWEAAGYLTPEALAAESKRRQEEAQREREAAAVG